MSFQHKPANRICTAQIPVVDCIQKLSAHEYLYVEVDTSGGAEEKLLTKMIDSVCKCHESGDDQIELLVLKTMLSAVMTISTFFLLYIIDI